MTAANDCPPQAPPRVLSGRTLRTYAADWALFVDWCDATEHIPLPADPGTVLGFLAGCPAAVKTQRGRVTAIDHQHTATGYAPPGQTQAVSAVLGRPVPGPFTPTPDTTSVVENMLRLLPSHGWTHGMFGRRDRCLLVLSQLAGVPYQHLAVLTAGDITLIDDGTATVTAGTRTWTIPPVDDPVVCGPCAVVRWLRVLDIAATKISTAAVADGVGHAEKVTTDSPHQCRSTRTLDAATLGVPLLPPINQWGALPFPHPRLSPHATSRRTRDLLAGELVIHRTLPIPARDTDDQPRAAASTLVEEPAVGAVFDQAAAQRAWTKRRNDLDSLADVADVLTDIDQQIATLQQRVNALLDGQTT